MTVWPNVFSPELFARLLLDQNQEWDVFDVWIGNAQELESIASVFESQFNCTVIRQGTATMKVCCPPIPAELEGAQSWSDG